MQVSQHELDEVNRRLDAQSGVKAAVAVAIGSIPLLVCWYWIYQLNDTFAPVLLALSGVLIGLLVRFYGRGYSMTFGMTAFIAHALLVASAFLFGMSLGEGQSVRAFILVGLYAFGAWAAVFIGRMSMPFELHRAFFVLAEQTQHPSNIRFRNRWFYIAPITAILCSVAMFVSLVVLSVVEGFSLAEEQFQVEQQHRTKFESQAIDVSPLNLASLSTKEAMRHAYAFYNGYLPSHNGKKFTRYPKSDYKAKRILMVLNEVRKDTRAQFILGRLTYNENGLQLIQQAADKGDIYAKIHMATEFGCYGDTVRARDLLNRLADTTTDESAKNEIYSILTTGVETVCSEFSSPDFALMYIGD